MEQYKQYKQYKQYILTKDLEIYILRGKTPSGNYLVTDVNNGGLTVIEDGAVCETYKFLSTDGNIKNKIQNISPQYFV